MSMCFSFVPFCSWSTPNTPSTSKHCFWIRSALEGTFKKVRNCPYLSPPTHQWLEQQIKPLHWKTFVQFSQKYWSSMGLSQKISLKICQINLKNKIYFEDQQCWSQRKVRSLKVCLWHSLSGTQSHLNTYSYIFFPPPSFQSQSPWTHHTPLMRFIFLHLIFYLLYSVILFTCINLLNTSFNLYT